MVNCDQSQRSRIFTICSFCVYKKLAIKFISGESGVRNTRLLEMGIAIQMALLYVLLTCFLEPICTWQALFYLTVLVYHI